MRYRFHLPAREEAWESRAEIGRAANHSKRPAGPPTMGKCSSSFNRPRLPGTINVTVSSGTLTSATLALTTVAQQINTAIRGPASMNTLASGRASLLSCVQNPGSKNIRVDYRVDVPGAVNLSVISSSGRAVSCLTNKYHQTGTYSLEWNPMNKSGVYFFVLKTSNDKTIRKALMVQ